MTQLRRETAASASAGQAGSAIGAGRRTRFLTATRPSLDRAYRLAGLLLGNAHEAEDAVQDALVIAWQSFDTLRDATKFDAWFDRIVVNGCRDRLRRRGVVTFIPMSADHDAADRDPYAIFLERDSLLASVNSLNADERAVVVLRFWADLPLEGIADRLDLPLGTVKSRLHRALGRLRDGIAAKKSEVSR
jgi:RNA polymerase sigma factor (sigma-70 family)